MRTVVAGLAFLLLAPGCADPVSPLEKARDRGLTYLREQRDANGAYDAAFVPYMVEVADASGLDPRSWPEGLPLARQFRMPDTNASLLGSLRALHAATLLADDGLRDQAVARVTGAYDGRQFGEPRLLNDDSFAILVLGSTSVPFALEPYRSMPDSLVQNQSSNHGWSWTLGGQGETDMTGIVLNSLSKAQGTGRDGPWSAVEPIVPEHVLLFLNTTKTADGGHALMAGGRQGNCNSTVWAIRAYELLGWPAPEQAWAFLLALQNQDGGFAFTPGNSSNLLCSAEAATLLGMAVQGTVRRPSTD